MGALGVNHYVVKPVKRHELYAAVSDAMAAVSTSRADRRRASPGKAQRFGGAYATTVHSGSCWRMTRWTIGC